MQIGIDSWSRAQPGAAGAAVDLLSPFARDSPGTQWRSRAEDIGADEVHLQNWKIVLDCNTFQYLCANDRMVFSHLHEKLQGDGKPLYDRANKLHQELNFCSRSVCPSCVDASGDRQGQVFGGALLLYRLRQEK